jgi:hypothetical protein
MATPPTTDAVELACDRTTNPSLELTRRQRFGVAWDVTDVFWDGEAAKLGKLILPVTIAAKLKKRKDLFL